MLGFDKLIFTIWRFIKDKRGQMRAIDFAIALSIFLIAFSQVLGMAINSAANVTEQTTSDHIYITGNSISNTLLTSTGGFDWDDTSANNLQNANGLILGLHNSSSNSPGFALHPNALARLDPGSRYYLPIINQTQYGVPDPYYDSGYHHVNTGEFNAHNASNIPRPERFYFGIHSTIRLDLYNRTSANQLLIQANVTDNDEFVGLQDLDLYVVSPDGSIDSFPNLSNGDEIVAIADLSVTGRYAIVGMAESDVGNWDFRVIIYDNNPLNYNINLNATLLQTSSLDAELHSWESGNASDITVKQYSVIFGENDSYNEQVPITSDVWFNTPLGSISSIEPIVVIVNVVDGDGNRGVNFTTLPLLFDGDVRPNQQIRPVYGLDPIESTIYAEYVHNYVSVRGMVFEATICYWRIS